MTDSQKFTLIETTKNIEKMGFSIEIFHDKQIQIASDNFNVIWEKDNFIIINKNIQLPSMNQEQWENYSGEIDNLDRAILWVNTQLKSVVFDS